MNLSVGKDIRVQNPTGEFMEWVQVNLVFDNPEYATRFRMGKSLYGISKHIQMYSTIGDTVVIPFGCLKDILRNFRFDHSENVFRNTAEVNYGNPMPLYPYQQVALDECYKAKFGVLIAPAGSGKTQMGLALIQQYGKRALWVTHTQDLLNQSKVRAEQYMNKHLMGTITEGKVNIGSGITFATVQTLANIPLWDYQDMWDVIVVDECHRVGTNAKTLTQFAKVLSSLAARHKYGLTATAHRSDGLITGTFRMLGDICYEVPKDAVKDKIMTVKVQPIGTGVRLTRECYGTDGMLNYTKMITYLCDNPIRAEVILSTLEHNREYSSIILSDRVEHLRYMMSNLPKSMQRYAAVIDGKMTSKKAKAERAEAIEMMRTGDLKYLFATYKLCKEGLDIPRLERLYMASPVKDYAVIVQSLGRIARTFEGKADPIAYDFVDDDRYLVRMFKERCRTYRKCEYEVLD